MTKTLKTTLFIALVAVMTACGSEKKYERNYTFENGMWDRFNKLQFEMPADVKPGNYDIIFTICLQETFEYDRFPIFVTLKTPSGEERTNEIEMKIKDNDRFYGQQDGGMYVITQKLWDGISIADTGVSMITVENLIPKIQTPGVQSVSMIMKSAGK